MYFQGFPDYFLFVLKCDIFNVEFGQLARKKIADLIRWAWSLIQNLKTDNPLFHCHFSSEMDACN